MPFLARAFMASSASSPSFASIAFLMTATKPSRLASRFSTSASTMRRMSPRASPTLPVCLRVNSTTSVASQTMWFGTDRLEPEGRDADRALADLGVPDEEAGGERLAVDLGPAGGVDEEAEQVLLPAVEPARPRRPAASLRRLEVGRELAEHRHEVRVVEPRVVRAVDRADEVVLGEELERLVARGEGLLEHAAGRLRREPVHGLLRLTRRSRRAG